MEIKSFTITKRDGQVERFSLDKIMNAIIKAFESVDVKVDLGCISKILSHLDIKEAVIATGGSVVYGSDAMKKLSKNSIVVYLKLDYNKLKYRLGNIKNRGVVIRDGQSLSGLYKERVPLYEKYADVTIDENGCNVEKTVSKLLAEVNGLL